ncbi:Hypothetical protein LLA12_02059 [Lactococcus lactis subsp. lactis]|nr:Hypothetical protein LLA12_02059 [Lactococcus lactis subsp. lactis]
MLHSGLECPKKAIDVGEAQETVIHGE